MFDVASPGGGVGQPVACLPVCSILSRLAAGCVLLTLLGWQSVAHAGSLYRCVGSKGEAVYSSSTAGYRGCHKISSFVSPVPRRKAPEARVSLTRVGASVVTTARNLGADGAHPTSLAGVRGGAMTTARALAAARVQRVSLAAVTGTAESSAKLPLAAVAAGTPAAWSYRESRGVSSVAAGSQVGGNKTLRGAVYRVAQPDGSVEYTNIRPSARHGRAVTMLFSYIATCAACSLHSPIHWSRVPLHLTAYSDSIRSASVEYGVDEAFLRAIIHAESAFNPRALSIKGAQGLMQLMPATASDMGVLDAFNTDQNIRGGARYLSLLLRDFHGNEKLAAAAYNAGPGAVERYSGVPPYAETRVYVQRVGILRRRYGQAIHPPLASSGPG
ncbi:MAG: lytic transglycosylase domain-containing protein [Rhodanobacter sp.]|nr:MAG: lytic transglycosylase domain-containing protein [Rhodanobacter sp.]